MAALQAEKAIVRVVFPSQVRRLDSYKGFGMRQKEAERIYATWKANSALHDDKSTGWLIQFTADLVGVDYGKVVDALSKINRQGGTIQKRVLLDIVAERKEQDKLWGPQDHKPFKWLAILGEEYGEACEAALEANNIRYRYREELIQVAAVAVAAVESIDRYYEGAVDGR